jgi:periplasmic protein TonB
VSSSPTIRFRGTKPPDPLPSNGRVDARNDASSQRLRVGGAIRPPIKVWDVRPVYPENAQADGIQGTIILGVVVGEDGTVTETAVLRSIPELDQAAIDAVRQWRFEPTLLNGEPVEVEMSVTVQFSLQ